MGVGLISEFVGHELANVVDHGPDLSHNAPLPVTHLHRLLLINRPRRDETWKVLAAIWGSQDPRDAQDRRQR